MQTFITTAARLGSTLGGAVFAGIAQLVVALANLRRRLLLGRLPDYVVVVLDQPLSERTPRAPWWYGLIPGRRSALSLEELTAILRRVARDEQVLGVLLLVKTAELTLTQAQSLAALFDRYRAWSAQVRREAPQRVVVHLEALSTPAYVMACAADLVTATPLTGWDVTGLQSAPLYLQETLAHFGVAVEVVKIAPWKTAVDTLSRSTMSDEGRAQLNWLFDSLFRDLIDAVSNGRDLAPSTVQQLIDTAPHTSHHALTAGLFDAVCYEDELPNRLGRAPESPATLKLYDRTRSLLRRTVTPRRTARIGVISLQGAIVTGESRQFPIPLPIAGERTIGSSTAQQLIRAARDDDRLAAVILHVESGGGSALASDLIWRELELLDAEKPLVVYMGNVAASGGYYIATPGRQIVAQSATLTGSIGVVLAKPVLQQAYVKADAHVELVRRGENAGLYQSDEPWTPSQRRLLEEEVRHVYSEFKQRVAGGRGLPLDSLDNLANGRVWTGAQAKALGLVDALGDFQTAVVLACQAAALPDAETVRLVTVTDPRRWRLADSVDGVQTLLGIKTARQWHGLAHTLVDGELMQMIKHERIWLWADGLPRLD